MPLQAAPPYMPWGSRLRAAPANRAGNSTYDDPEFFTIPDDDHHDDRYGYEGGGGNLAAVLDPSFSSRHPNIGRGPFPGCPCMGTCTCLCGCREAVPGWRRACEGCQEGAHGPLGRRAVRVPVRVPVPVPVPVSRPAMEAEPEVYDVGFHW